MEPVLVVFPEVADPFGEFSVQLKKKVPPPLRGMVRLSSQLFLLKNKELNVWVVKELLNAVPT